MTIKSKRTSASRQADYRRAKASREFAGTYLGGIMDVSALRYVVAKESEAMAKSNCSSVTFNTSVTNHFYDNVIYLTANDGTYSVLEMQLLWDKSLCYDPDLDVNYIKSSPEANLIRLQEMLAE